MQHSVCQGCEQVSPAQTGALAGTQQLLGPPHKETGREKGPLVPAKEWAERVGKGGEHGRGSALSPLGECDRLGLTAHKGAEQLGIK